MLPVDVVMYPLHPGLHTNTKLLLLLLKLMVYVAEQPLISVGQFRHAQHVSSIASVPFISTSLPSIIES